MSNINNQNVLSPNKTKDTGIIQNKFPMKDLEIVASEMTFFVQSLFSKKIESVSDKTNYKELERLNSENLKILNSRNQEVKKQQFFKFREAIFIKYPDLKKDSLTVTPKELKRILSAYLQESSNTLSANQIRELKFKISQSGLMEGQKINLEDNFTLEESKKKVEKLDQNQTELDQEFSLEKKIEILKKLIPLLDKNIDSINKLIQDKISKRININLFAKTRKKTIDIELENLKLKLFNENNDSEDDKKINDLIRCLIFPLCFFYNAPDEWKIDRKNDDFREYLAHLIQVSHNKKKEESDELYQEFLNLSDKLKNSVSVIDFLNNSDIDYCKRFNLPNISYLLGNDDFNQTLRLLPDQGLGLINDLLNRQKDIQENISYLLGSYGFNQFLKSLPDQGLELIIDLLDRDEDIQQNIYYLLGSDFIKTLQLLQEDKRIGLINDLLKGGKVIQQNICYLLGSDFIKTLQLLQEDKMIGLINDLLKDGKVIQQNISYLLGSSNFNKTLRSIPEDKIIELIELIKLFNEKKEYILDQTYNINDSAEEKITKIYNILGIEKTQKPQTELEIDSTEGQTAKKDNRISE